MICFSHLPKLNVILVDDSVMAFVSDKSADGSVSRLGSIKGGPYSSGCHTYEFERIHQYSIIDFNVDVASSDEPCIVIRSYHDDSIVFERQLCGRSIFSPVADVGSEQVEMCSEVFFSPLNTTLLCISGFLLLVSMTMSFFVFSGWCAALGQSLVILLIFSLTYVAGFFIPNTIGIDQYNALETIIICLLQIFTVTIYLITWRCYLRWDQIPANGAQKESSAELEL